MYLVSSILQLQSNIPDNVKRVIQDEDAFYMIMQYLYANNIYTKTNDEYIFRQSDVMEYAKKYALKDNFDYISKNPNFRYDSINKTFISKLQFNILGANATLLKSTDIYEKTETTASVIYEVEVNGVMTLKYNVTLDTSSDDYKILSITKIK